MISLLGGPSQRAWFASRPVVFVNHQLLIFSLPIFPITLFWSKLRPAKFEHIKDYCYSFWNKQSNKRKLHCQQLGAHQVCRGCGFFLSWASRWPGICTALLGLLRALRLFDFSTLTVLSEDSKTVLGKFLPVSTAMRWTRSSVSESISQIADPSCIVDSSRM